jgi:hypothetical protein
VQAEYLDKVQSSKLENFLSEMPPLSKSERVEVYSYAWCTRLEESLADDYEVLAKSLGEEGFSELVRSYLQACPSQSYTLVELGDRFPEFILSWEAKLKKPWHAELATLERSYYQSFLAQDPQPWSFAELSQYSVEDAGKIRLSLENAVSLLSSNWTVDEVWKGKRKSPRNLPRRYLVYRQGFRVQIRSLRIEEYRVLEKLKSRLTLNELIDLFPEEKTIQWISEWAVSGIIKPIISECAEP